MKFIKQIIREQLEKVLSNLSESDLYNVTTKENPKNSIIYDYEKGTEFAGNHLETDILNLNRYNLIDYLPKNTNEEMWSFEFTTVYGVILMIDINRIVNGNKSFWSIKFGQLNKGEQVPQLIAELENIEGYDNFISATNNKFSKIINPSKY
jgi:hypothetical protein